MPEIRFYEDHVRITIMDNEKRNIILNNLLAANVFEEVVTGINELCLKFDPLKLSEEEVTAIISAQKAQPVGEISANKQHYFHIDFKKALDIAMVCNHMNMNEAEFQYWFLNQKFIVDMMGFQPGFAYLSHKSEATSIPRLDKPRSLISKGSIGFLGKTACIYAHDGPGGWPIIGCITTPIFNQSLNPPNILQCGDTIIFDPL